MRPGGGSWPADRTAEWLRSAMEREPLGPSWIDQVDPRCWEVTRALDNIYNLSSGSLPNRGMRPIPMGNDQLGGVAMYLRADMATQDFDELTSLVIAAHQHACRVSIGSAALWGYQENPGDFESAYAEVTTEHHVVEEWRGETYNEWEPPTHAGCATCQRQLVRRHGGRWVHDDEQPDPPHDPEPMTVEVHELTGYIELMIHPRAPWGSTDTDWRGVSEHPTLSMLAARIAKLTHRPEGAT